MHWIALSTFWTTRARVKIMWFLIEHMPRKSFCLVLSFSSSQPLDSLLPLQMHPAAPPREKQQPKTGTRINNKLAYRLVFTSIKQGSRSHKWRCTVYESDYVPCEHQPLGIKKRSLTFLLVVEKVLNHLPHQQHSFFFCFPLGQTGQ